MADQIDETTRLAMFLAASPLFVDTESTNVSDLQKSLPQNIYDSLGSEDTAKMLWNLVVAKYGLSVDNVKDVARTVRDILTGNMSGIKLRETLQQRLSTSAPVIDEMVKAITQKFISPNYFQISQVYDRQQKRASSLNASASPGEARPSAERRDSSLPPPPPPATPPVRPGANNVVDLRNMGKTSSSSMPPVPPKLPPPPPSMPPRSGQIDV